LDVVEKKQIEYDTKFEEIFDAIQSRDIKPEKGIFFDGQIFDAYKFVSDLIQSATANASNNHKMAKEDLIIAKIFVDEGYTMKRARARAFGRSAPIRKRTSHITVVLKELKKLSQEIKNNKDVERVASISSADPEIGKMVAEAVERVGNDGLIMTENGKGMKTEIEYKSGLEFDKGYATSSAYFVNDPNSSQVVIEDAYILMTDIKKV